MNANLLFKALALIPIVFVAAQANTFDYILETSQSAHAYHQTSYDAADGSAMQQRSNDVVANALLSGAVKDEHPISVAILVKNNPFDSRAHLELGVESVIAKGIDYEGSFVGRIFFKDVFIDDLSLFLGGKIGMGESEVEKSQITFFAPSVFGGTASVEIPLPDKTKYIVTGAQLGFTYTITKNLELLTLFEIVGKESDLSKQINKDAAVSKAGSAGMNPMAMLSMLQSLGTQELVNYSVNCGIRFRF